ncbi:MAG TPA: hypothetical protein VNG51_10895 [Ktedonobacteraceae bacterium]|nr:hypothetical protein [Ktedonobacteraceae bacterium]
MFDFDYPRVKQSLGQAALQEPYPAWFLNPRGIIKAVNLMAFWLWDTMKSEESFTPEAILGTSSYTLLAGMMKRIPIEQNIELYTKKAALVKRLAAKVDKPYYASFIAAMKANPPLAHIYDQASLEIEHEWEYPLRILYPGQDNLSSPDKLLEFQVSNFRLVGDAGVLIICYPKAAYQSEVEAQYNRLMRQYGSNKYTYALPDDWESQYGETISLPAGLANATRVYYPAVIQDSLWYLVKENRAHQLIAGGSVVGLHFFELFFAPQLKKWMGPIQETSAPRAVKYFDVFTTEFMREDHELHNEFAQVMKKLLQMPGFCELLELSRKLPMRITIPEDDETTFYTCRVILPWPFSPDVTMQFRSMVRFIQQGLLGYSDGRNYRVVLVPENYETDAALLLLYLAATASILDEAPATSLKQYLWLLTIMRTLREGITRNEKEGMQWEPEIAFGTISDQLAEQYSAATEETTATIIATFRAIVAELDSKGMVNRNLLLTMLQSMTATLPSTEQLATFLTKELTVVAVST